uniref:UDENN domain-containing protein n=1 Tax=Ornithorhynchus anatinus TaxID=9258 RepID=A0A6I8NL45_ORNAN
MLPKFCFPYDVERVTPNPMVQHFTFVLTDLEGNRRFGFCRLAGGALSCLCILSYLPWFEVFYKLLNNVGDLLAKGQVSEAEELLSALYLHPVPGPHSPMGLELVSLCGLWESCCLCALNSGVQPMWRAGGVGGGGMTEGAGPCFPALPSNPPRFITSPSSPQDQQHSKLKITSRSCPLPQGPGESQTVRGSQGGANQWDEGGREKGRREGRREGGRREEGRGEAVCAVVSCLLSPAPHQLSYFIAPDANSLPSIPESVSLICGRWGMGELWAGTPGPPAHRGAQAQLVPCLYLARGT